jgi:glutathione-regulated potassium-efflux system ancillary protein KefF
VILVLYAHPHHERSIAQRALLSGIDGLPGVEIHRLYDRYPDFAIDAAAERARLASAHTLVWQHPLYWYAAPALLKLWFEVVLTRGWAWGEGATALAGKHVLWVTSTGAPEDGYRADGLHGHALHEFASVLRQTARFCGMTWEEPLVVHGAHRIDAAALADAARRYRERLVELAAAARVPGAAPKASA